LGGALRGGKADDDKALALNRTDVPAQSPAFAAAPPPMAALGQSRGASASSSLDEGGKKEKGGGGGAAMAAAQQSYDLGNFNEATKQFDALASGGDTNAALWAARSVRQGSGCAQAVGRYDALASRATGTPVANQALLEAGKCYRQMGATEQARSRLVQLQSVPGFADAAQQELAAMSPPTAKPAPRAAPAAPKKPAQDMGF
jgi:hypothetical protein